MSNESPSSKPYESNCSPLHRDNERKGGKTKPTTIESVMKKIATTSNGCDAATSNAGTTTASTTTTVLDTSFNVEDYQHHVQQIVDDFTSVLDARTCISDWKGHYGSCKKKKYETSSIKLGNLYSAVESFLDGREVSAFVKLLPQSDKVMTTDFKNVETVAKAEMERIKRALKERGSTMDPVDKYAHDCDLTAYQWFMSWLECDVVTALRYTDKYPPLEDDPGVKKSSHGKEIDISMYPTFPSAPNNRFYYRVDCTLCDKNNMSELTYNQHLKTELHTKLYQLHNRLTGSPPEFLKEHIHRFTRTHQDRERKRRYQASHRKRARVYSSNEGEDEESCEDLLADEDAPSPVHYSPKKKHKKNKKNTKQTLH